MRRTLRQPSPAAALGPAPKMLEVGQSLFALATIHQKLGPGKFGLHDQQCKTRAFRALASLIQKDRSLFESPQMAID